MSNDTPKDVSFTRQQIAYLNRMFPEMVGDANTTTDALRFRAGQRSVIVRIMLNEASPSPGDT